ncbi:MAG: hypothetical protein JWO30_2237 [Fibrobacteres bacterium]|nr:hypothetical protein [Fibrobacterota bacterium]
MTRLKSWLLAVSAFSGISHGAQICNLVFDKCPSNFTSGTITVPQSVIWLDPVVPVCSENVQVVTGTDSPPPSIVFIIDNSGSMSSGTSGSNNSWNDPTEARFNVVKTLLDTIAAASPKAEVGLVIFSRRLQFDHRDNPFFKTAFPGDTSQHDSYVPLTALDQDFGGGIKGVDTLKALLGFTGHGNLNYATKLPASRPNTGVTPDNIRDGTDITLGFDAAKEAMKTAKAPKGDQYFIFLSDGEPSGVDTPRQGTENDFQKGTNVPTTFTVFFKANATNPTAPASIVTMTTAIKGNGYSASNPKSAYFAISLPGSQLLTLLQSSVLNPIFSNTPGKPVSAVMAVGGTNYNSTAVDAKNFTFPKRVPLSADQTVVNLTYTYSYTDSGVAKTKIVPYTLTVKRSGTGPLGDGLSSSCQDQGNITLFNNGTQVNLVTADHNDLDVHLTLSNGETCNGCSVEVKPSKSPDKENVTLSPNGGIQVGHFERETSTLVKADGKLQHLPTDSIIVTYVNPDNPLDVIRKAFPYSDVSTILKVISHNDYSRGGDVVDPKPGEHFVLVAPVAVNPTPESGKNWSITPALTTVADSVRYVGSTIEASRAFKVEVRVYTNLGAYVNKIQFSLTQSEFNKLSKGVKSNTRQIGVMWDNIAEDGTKAGTGAYILKTTVTLLKIPGIAEDEAVSTDYRIVGVLHTPR